MTRYVFVRWLDGPTTLTRSITVTSDITLNAVYAKVVRNVVVDSNIIIQFQIGGQTFTSGQTVQVDDGTTINVTIPQEVIQ